MASTNVAKFAAELKMPAEALLDATRPVLAADLALQADRTQPATARLRRIALLLALPT